MSATPSHAEKQVETMLAEAARWPAALSKRSSANAYDRALRTDVPPGSLRTLIRMIREDGEHVLATRDCVLLVVECMEHGIEMDRVGRRKRRYRPPKDPSKSPRAPREKWIVALIVTLRDAPDHFADAGLLPHDETDPRRLWQHLFSETEAWDVAWRELLHKETGSLRVQAYTDVKLLVAGDSGYLSSDEVWRDTRSEVRRVLRSLGQPTPTDEEVQGLYLAFVSDQFSKVRRQKRRQVFPGTSGRYRVDGHAFRGRFRTFMKRYVGGGFERLSHEPVALEQGEGEDVEFRQAERLSALAKLEQLFLLADLSDREQQMVRFSYDGGWTDPAAWGTSDHYRALQAAGFPRSRSGVWTMAKRVRQKLRRATSA